MKEVTVQMFHDYLNGSGMVGRLLRRETVDFRQPATNDLSSSSPRGQFASFPGNPRPRAPHPLPGGTVPFPLHMPRATGSMHPAEMGPPNESSQDNRDEERAFWFSYYKRSYNPQLGHEVVCSREFDALVSINGLNVSRRIPSNDQASDGNLSPQVAPVMNHPILNPSYEPILSGDLSFEGPSVNHGVSRYYDPISSGESFFHVEEAEKSAVSARGHYESISDVDWSVYDEKKPAVAVYNDPLSPHYEPISDVDWSLYEDEEPEVSDRQLNAHDEPNFAGDFSEDPARSERRVDLPNAKALTSEQAKWGFLEQINMMENWACRYPTPESSTRVEYPPVWEEFTGNHHTYLHAQRFYAHVHSQRTQGSVGDGHLI